MTPVKTDVKPTEQFYSLFQYFYDYLNKHLFFGDLPECMIVITRKNNIFGYFHAERWVNQDEKKTDEIAINPFYFDKKPLIEILQTIAHEMAHQWQHHFGKPSRSGYHNKEWARKMIKIGLMPSDTGLPGGKTTGPQMMDYPIKGGSFVAAANKIIKLKKFQNLWFDRINNGDILNIGGQLETEVYNDLNLDPQLLEIHSTSTSITVKYAKNKIKYSCGSCGISLWGKGDLNVICGDCEVPLDPQ